MLRVGVLFATPWSDRLCCLVEIWRKLVSFGQTRQEQELLSFPGAFFNSPLPRSVASIVAAGRGAESYLTLLALRTNHNLRSDQALWRTTRRKLVFFR
jgi:hypothetical protein